jgi:hypothetical protein
LIYEERRRKEKEDEEKCILKPEDEEISGPQDA